MSNGENTKNSVGEKKNNRETTRKKVVEHQKESSRGGYFIEDLSRNEKNTTML